MLQKLSKQAAECHRRAREAAERAASATDPATKLDYDNLERRWLTLARSYEFSQRVEDFNKETKRRIAAFRPPTPPHPALPIVSCPDCGRKMYLTRIEPVDGGSRQTFECACGASLNRIAQGAG